MYSKGIVYKIVCNLSDVVYIGSTFNKLRHRWSQHKHEFKRWLVGKGGCFSIFPYFKEHGIKNFTIIKIKEYTVYRENNKDRRHLSVYEQLWINKTKCVNKYNPIQFLYKNQYYNNNREAILIKAKEYQLKNKDKISAKAKEYYNINRGAISTKVKEYCDTNRDKIRERQKVKHTCKCGSNYTQVNKKRHLKTQKHKKYVASLV
jgi:hypothetical protein